VDIDSPSALIRRHCPQRTVILTTDDDSAGMKLRALPGVEVSRSEDSVLTVRGDGAELMTSVIQCLADGQIRVTDFQTVVPTLEDVFLKLTGHTIRQ
jgi:ABC-2 type transport system ATP-binding protein